MRKSTPVRIFVVEDEPMYLRLVKYVMELDPEHEVHTFTSGAECLKNLHLRPQIISIDFNLPDMDGGKLMHKVKSVVPEAGIIIVSGQKDVKTAVGLCREGAFDYITKDEETKEQLLHTLRNLKSQLSLRTEVETLKTQLVEQNQFDKLMIGDSPSMQKTFEALQRASQTNISVSITGETGTGKELAAKAIHFNSNRAKGPFVAVNMSAIPKDLLESELFGHEKGAFTGAMARKLGQFELADKGTLFLDEIGDLDPFLQAKLLRAVQEREFIRVGGMQPVKFDARVVTATHKDLQKEVLEGRFREDLYYRLLGFPIQMPPLRDREKDVLLLANHFATEFAQQNRLGKVSLTRDGKDKLMGYHFPGNVRELKAVVELACALSNDGLIESRDLRFNSLTRRSASDNWLDADLTLEQIKDKVIVECLERFRGDVLAVAKHLDIGKSTIYRLLKDKA